MRGASVVLPVLVDGVFFDGRGMQVSDGVVKALARLWSCAAAVLFVALGAFASSPAQAQGITISPPGLTSVLNGVPYNQTLSATGRTAPYTFTISAGALPPGLTLSSSGSLTGTSTTDGTYDFTVRATDVNSFTNTRNYRLVVRTPVVNLSPSSLPPATGQPYNQYLSASGGRAP